MTNTEKIILNIFICLIGFVSGLIVNEIYYSSNSNHYNTYIQNYLDEECQNMPQRPYIAQYIIGDTDYNQGCQ